MRNERRRTPSLFAALLVVLAACDKPAPTPDPSPPRPPAAAEGAAAPPGAPGAHPAAAKRDGQADFDFFMGSWKVHNKRLRRPLTGSTEWYEFDAKVVARKIWGGKANMDEYEAQGPDGPIRGLTVRLYEPQSRQWRIYWANQARGVIDVPVVGEFKEGRGEFYDQEIFEGKSIFVRYVWSDIKANSARWEQAFSEDGGKTWETNWIMEETRVPE